MKKYICLLILTSSLNKLSSQTLSFNFVKNCITYSDTKLADDLYKANFYLANKKMEAVSNKCYIGSQYFSNDKERNLSNGEIGVLANKDGNKKVIEISFIASNETFLKNFNSLYPQIKANFKNEKSFYSLKYKSEIEKYTFNGLSYYIYKDDGNPIITISNYRLEEECFSN